MHTPLLPLAQHLLAVPQQPEVCSLRSLSRSLRWTAGCCQAGDNVNADCASSPEDTSTKVTPGSQGQAARRRKLVPRTPPAPCSRWGRKKECSRPQGLGAPEPRCRCGCPSPVEFGTKFHWLCTYSQRRWRCTGSCWSCLWEWFPLCLGTRQARGAAQREWRSSWPGVALSVPDGAEVWHHCMWRSQGWALCVWRGGCWSACATPATGNASVWQQTQGTLWLLPCSMLSIM